MFDQLEWRLGADPQLALDAGGWVGTDRHRFWYRAEGEAEDASFGHGELDLLYGRAITPFFDVVVGVRQDFRAGAGSLPELEESWFAGGIRGLAPYWFEVEALIYQSPEGRTAARFEAEYDLLITNWLILGPEAELAFTGDDAGGPTSVFEAGVRLRYELKREFAPYLGLHWERAAGGSGGESSLRVAAGLRLWF